MCPYCDDEMMICRNCGSPIIIISGVEDIITELAEFYSLGEFEITQNDGEYVAIMDDHGGHIIAELIGVELEEAGMIPSREPCIIQGEVWLVVYLDYDIQDDLETARESIKNALTVIEDVGRFTDEVESIKTALKELGVEI